MAPGDESEQPHLGPQCLALSPDIMATATLRPGQGLSLCVGVFDSSGLSQLPHPCMRFCPSQTTCTASPSLPAKLKAEGLSPHWTHAGLWVPLQPYSYSSLLQNITFPHLTLPPKTALYCTSPSCLNVLKCKRVDTGGHFIYKVNTPPVILALVIFTR